MVTIIILVVLFGLINVFAYYWAFKTMLSYKNRLNEFMDNEQKSGNEILNQIRNLEDMVDKLQVKLLSFSIEQTEQILQLKESIMNLKDNSLGKQLSNEQKNIAGRKNETETVVSPLSQETKVEVFPAMPQMNNEQAVLKVVANEYMKQATFIVEANGSTGYYTVNSNAENSLLNYLDTTVVPYTDCELKTSGIPNRIVTENKGTVRLENDIWIIETKAVVKIY